MLTVRRNLDRTRQPILTYLCYSNSFLHLSWSFLIHFRFTLIILTFFLLKTNEDFTLLKSDAFRNRRPTPRNKNKTIFIGIYTLECLFLWYLFDLDLWLSVISCGVMSTITPAYTYRKKTVIKISKWTRLSLIKESSLAKSILSWKSLSYTHRSILS
jgi:hypothetical protein